MPALRCQMGSQVRGNSSGGFRVTPGVHNMPAAQYHADPCDVPSLSSHIANILNTQSPRHAWFAHPRLNPHYVAEEDNAFDLGSCAHAVLLEGEGSVAAVEAKDWRTKEAQQTRDALRAQGKIPVLAHKLVAIRAMADAARTALAACGLGAIDLGTGDAEQVLIWNEGKVRCRARPDWRRRDRKLLIDYKSTAGSAEPSAWIRNQMKPMGFDVQAVHYQRGNAATDGPRIADWIFLVQENYPPFECSFVALSNADQEIAQRKWEFAVALWDKCMEKNRWNGYPKSVAISEPMSWELAGDEDLRLRFEERLELFNA